MDEREPAEDGCIFRETETDVGKWFWRCVRDQARGSFCSMRDQTGAAGQKKHHDFHRRIEMAEHAKSEERAADRSNDGMNRVPGRIDPWNLVGKKLQEIQNAGDGDDGGMPEDLERFILRRERDPMLIDRETGQKNRPLKIDPCERGKS